MHTTPNFRYAINLARAPPCRGWCRDVANLAFINDSPGDQRWTNNQQGKNMKTIRVANAFKKNATGRDPLVRVFKKGIEEMLAVVSSKLDSFKIEGGVVTLTVDDGDAADRLVAALGGMRGVDIQVANSTFETFLVRFNQDQEITAP